MDVGSIDTILDDIWDSAEDTIDFGGVKVSFNVRPNISKEQWKKQFKVNIFGEQDYYVLKSGKIIMPELNII